jgi:hypothetical protein
MGKEIAGGEQNDCGAAASRLVGRALSAIPVFSSKRARLLRSGQPGHFAGSAHGASAITRRNTSRTRTDVGAGAARRILFVSCRPSWR